MTFLGVKPPTMMWSIFESSNFSQTVSRYWKRSGSEACSRSAKSSQDFHAMTLYCHAFRSALSTVRAVLDCCGASRAASSSPPPPRAFLAAGSIVSRAGAAAVRGVRRVAKPRRQKAREAIPRAMSFS